MKNLAILFALFLASGLILTSIACGSDGEETTLSPLVQPSSTITSGPPVILEPVEITIGNLTDITGPSSNALVVITTALEDLARYYNEHNIIPGVELKVINYDTQYDPTRFTTGYEWLKSRGADLIFTSVPDTPLALKPIVNKDKMPLFSASGYVEQLDPPGYVFILGTIPEHQVYTFLNWIAENDWAYEAKGPAKIGGASWRDGYSDTIITEMKRYCALYPDQFEWVGGYLKDFTFTWGSEVESLKDCDYVFPCVMPVAFMKEYTGAGYTAKFISFDAQTGFFSLISDAQLWADIDGALFIKGGATWWTDDDDELIKLNKKLLYENHPDEAGEIIRAGSGYLAVAGIFYPMFEMIADAVEAVGAENFSSQSLYDAAISYSLVIDGVERSGFTETRRYALTNYQIYKASAADEDIIMADENWIPHLVEP